MSDNTVAVAGEGGRMGRLVVEGLRATGVAVRVVSTTPLLADLPESV